MAYIALPIFAWQRLLETGWMTCGPARTNLVLAHGNLHPARTDLRPASTENQPELTSGALFHGYFHVLRRVQ